MEQTLGESVVIDYILMGITILPIISLGGFLFRSEDRLRMVENPLIPIYFIIIFGYFFLYWFKPYILTDYVQLNMGLQMVIYGILALSPLFQSDLPN